MLTQVAYHSKKYNELHKTFLYAKVKEDALILTGYGARLEWSTESSRIMKIQRKKACYRQLYWTIWFKVTTGLAKKKEIQRSF